MRITLFASLSLCLASASASVLAASVAPTPAQVTTAIQQSEAERIQRLEQTDPAAAERARSLPVAALAASFKAHTVKGCLPASGGEIVCIVGIKAGLRDGYRAVAFRDNPEPWVLARREVPDVNGPDATQATAAMREFAREELKKNPSAEDAAELTSMMQSLVVKQLHNCSLRRNDGNLGCEAVISTDGQPEKRVSGFGFALEGSSWRFVPHT